MPPRSPSIRFASVIVFLTFIAYQPAWTGGILWDDDAHLTTPALRSVEGLGRIWFELGTTQQYYPVTHSVFWFEHLLWGDTTLGYHLINIGLHALSACLLVAILVRLGVPRQASLFAGAVFALHPVQVESVAWMTELKNTLSGTLYLGAAWFYLHFDERRDRRRYAAAFALFVAALLSKSVTATLPAVLLVVMWWKRGRLRLMQDVVPLVPFLAIGLISGLTTAWIERSVIGAEGAAFAFTWLERTLIAGRAFWFYLATLAWPANLTFIYPRWTVSQQIWSQYLYPLAAVLLVVGLWLLRRRSRAPLAAVLCFAGTLFPALGFFNVYPFQFSFVADHFQYLACLFVITLASVGLSTLANRFMPRLTPAAGAVAVIVLAALTWNQSHIYADAATLYHATLDRNPGCWMAHDNLGQIKLDRATSVADVDDAMADFRASLAINPRNAPAHSNLGLALRRLGRTEDALAEFTAATRIEPRFAEAHNNRATALADLNRLDEALAESRESVRLKPGQAEAQSTLGSVLQRRGQVEEAVPHIEESLRLDPRVADTHINLGNAYGRLGRFDDSIGAYRRALSIDNRSWRAHANLGYVLLQSGRASESIPELQEALRLEPDAAGVGANLAAALNAVTRERQ